MFALLFPGQGSQTPDDRVEVAALAPDLLQRCTEALGEDPFPRASESTRFAQPALFVTSLARLARAGVPPEASALAGHSLGEITALTAAGALTVDDGLRLVIERGRLMGEAEAGGMVAVKADAADVAALAAEHGLVVANDNAPGQVVLSGHVDGIAPLLEAARERGLRAMRLPVTGAFHSPLMASARAAFAEVLADVDFRPATTPVYCCATAEPFENPGIQLAEALTAPVRWRELLLELDRLGVTEFADVGPGRVLDGLVRRTLPNATRTDLVRDVVA